MPKSRVSNNGGEPLTCDQKVNKDITAIGGNAIYEGMLHISSALIVLVGFGICMYGIGSKREGHPGGLHMIFFFVVAMLGYLESLQTCIGSFQNVSKPKTKQEKKQEKKQKFDEPSHPRAFRLHKLATDLDNVQSSLTIGRQIFFAFVVLLCLKLTTYPEIDLGNISEALFYIFIKTGLPGVIAVLFFGRHVPRLLSENPTTFMNIPGAIIVLYITLIIERIGTRLFSWVSNSSLKSCFDMYLYVYITYSLFKYRTIVTESVSNLLTELTNK